VVVTAVSLVLLVAGTAGRRRWIVAVLWAWTAFIIGLVGIVGVLALRGTLAEAWDAVFLFNTRYSGADAWLWALRDWGRALDAIEPIQFAVWLALLGVLVVVFGRRMGRFPRLLAVSLLIWFLIEVILALVGPSRSCRYWQGIWPPVILLAAAAFRYFQLAFRHLRGGYRAGFAVTVITLGVLLLAPTWRHYTYGLSASYLEYTGQNRERDHLRALAARLRELVPDVQPIYVLNYDSGVYVYSGLPCVSRFTYPRSHEQVGEILRELEEGRAAAILVPDGPTNLPSDYMNDEAMARVDAVASQYDLVERFPGPAAYDIYLKRSDPRASQTWPANP